MINDMITLSKAKYLLSLSDGEVTDDIRNAYKEYIVNEYTAIDALAVIIKTIDKTLPDSSEDINHVVTLIGDEYNNLGLNTFIGEYSSISEFIKEIFSIRLSEIIDDTNTKVEMYKKIVSLSETNETIKPSVYYTVLHLLIRDDGLFVDKEFSNHVVSYVDTIEVSEIVRILTACIEHVLV